MIINQIEIGKAIAKGTRSMEPFMRNAARTRFKAAHEKLLKDFNTHPVTQEIENGAFTENISNTLNGKGNLFSFLGFEEGSSPTEEVRDILENEIEMEPSAIIKNYPNRTIFNFKVIMPDMDELESRTPMHWESGRSWLRAIEKGVSGFSNYIYWKLAGRSGGGLQAKKPLREGSFHPVSYLTAMIKKFKNYFSI